MFLLTHKETSKRLLSVPQTARRSNQSIPKEVNLEYSLEGLMLKLKLQYFGHLIWRADSLEKTLMLGKTEGRRRRGWDGWMASPTQRIWVWASSGRWWRTGKPDMLQTVGSQRVGHNWATEQKNRHIYVGQGYRNMKIKAKLFFPQCWEEGVNWTSVRQQNLHWVSYLQNCKIAARKQKLKQQKDTL